MLKTFITPIFTLLLFQIVIGQSKISTPKDFLSFSYNGIYADPLNVDSVPFINSDRHHQIYIQRLDSSVSWNFNSGSLQKTGKSIPTFQDDNLINLSLFSFSNGQYSKYFETLYSYDNDHRITSYELYTKPTQVALELQEKKEFAYNSDGLLREQKDYIQDLQGQWIVGSITIFGYDSLENISEYEVNLWSNTNNQWEGWTKFDKTFDSFDQMTSETYYNWDSQNNFWVKNSKREFVYSPTQQLLKTTQFLWNIASSTFDLVHEEERLYNSFDYLNFEIEKTWNNTSNQLVPIDSTIYEYNAQNKLTKQTHIYFNDVDSNWHGTYKDSLNYNSHNQKESRYLYQFDHNLMKWNWIQLDSTEINAAGDSIKEISYGVLNGSSTLVNLYRNITAFDSYGNANYFEYSDWNSGTLSWVITQKSEYTYSSTGLKLQEIRYNWDHLLQVLKGDIHYTYVYDSNDLVIQIEHLIWDGNSFEKGALEEYFNEQTFNSKFVISQHNSKEWNPDSLRYLDRSQYSIVFDHTIDPEQVLLGEANITAKQLSSEQKEINPITHQMRTIARSQNYYSPIFPDGIKENKPISKIVVFPNPTSNVIRFETENFEEFSQIRFFDSMGKLIFTSPINAHTVIPTFSWSKGIYVYQIVGENGNQVGKLIKN